MVDAYTFHFLSKILDFAFPCFTDEDQFSEEANAAMDEMTRGAALLAQVRIAWKMAARFQRFYFLLFKERN